MNPVASRLKAVAVTALFFALSAMGLLGAIWGLSALPVPFPGRSELAAYGPHATIAVLSDLRLVFVLTAAFLVATAIVLVFESAYLDKMIAVFSDVLLMAMAAMAGIVGGYWTLLRLMGDDAAIRVDPLAAAICPLVIFIVSLVPPHRARSPLVLRIVSILALVAAAPLLLIVPG